MALTGKDGYVDTGSAVSGIKSWTVTQNVAEHNTTDFGDAGVSTFIPGCSDWSGAFEGYKDGVLQTLGSNITLKLYTDATYFFTGTAFITSAEATSSPDAVNAVSYTFRGTGALTAPLG